MGSMQLAFQHAETCLTTDSQMELAQGKCKVKLSNVIHTLVVKIKEILYKGKITQIERRRSS
jgi:hypothetical protein